MGQQRRPLRPITGNANKRRELTPFVRGIIKGKLLDGKTPTDIAKDLNIPRPTIYTTKQNLSSQVDGKSKPRSGRPLSYTTRDTRHIYTIVRRDPYATYNKIRQ